MKNTMKILYEYLHSLNSQLVMRGLDFRLNFECTNPPICTFRTL